LSSKENNPSLVYRFPCQEHSIEKTEKENAFGFDKEMD
jgi:hypothetical protein